MEITFTSKDGREVTYWMRDQGGYIFCDCGNRQRAGTLGAQPTNRNGNTYAATPATFKRVAKRLFDRAQQYI